MASEVWEEAYERARREGSSHVWACRAADRADAAAFRARKIAAWREAKHLRELAIAAGAPDTPETAAKAARIAAIALGEAKPEASAEPERK